MMLFGHENGRPTSALTFHRNFADGDVRAYAEHFVDTSPYVERGLTKLPVGRARLSEAVISNDDLARTEFYNDFIRARGLGCYAAGVIIERNQRRSVALSLADHKDDADRRQGQLRLLDLLTPHIARAFRLHGLLDRERQQGRAALLVFETWAHAALLLSSDGRLVTMNRAAEQMAALRDGIALSRDGRLRATTETANAALDQAIFACAAGGPHIAVNGLALPRLSGGFLNAMISPLPQGAECDGALGKVLVILVDADAERRTPIQWITTRYGLAPAEARLAALLVQGDTLAEAASALGIKLSTARTRLKAVQAKTGCHRQADLVRLALSMPVLRS
ncbi:hypothetical protein CSW64_11085 [Caulobacter mirabilis]|uniref:HTH luxR-type domain-containing protein n=2 Tax=Caulobacter mirabilis TaxID=69666 RepID=A0A2D2AY47_9CAUL|nr:hypothetical protein CSW64_11085 [Caulobacter mirabilis]